MIISFATRLLFATYFLEAGLVLIVAPWSAFWDKNAFLALVPKLEGMLASPYVRGAVSGIGLVTLLAGVAELFGAFTARRHAAGAPHEQGLRPDR